MQQKQVINAGDWVKAHVSLFLADKSVADSTKTRGEHCVIRLGMGDFSEAFESQLIGEPLGETVRFSLPAVDAFGEHDAEQMHKMERSVFDAMATTSAAVGETKANEDPSNLEISEGLIVAFAQPNGGTVLGVVKAFDEQSVTVDFNHPLAGQTITFEIELLGIQPKSESKEDESC